MEPVKWHIHCGDSLRDFTLQYDYGGMRKGVLLRKYKNQNVEKYPTTQPNPFDMDEVIIMGDDYDL